MSHAVRFKVVCWFTFNLFIALCQNAAANPPTYTLGNFSRTGSGLPPDLGSSKTEPSIAVGPFQVLTQTQAAVRAYTKDGAPFPAFGDGSSSSPYLFYDIVNSLVNPTVQVDCPPEAKDPMMVFDPIALRFYALAWSHEHLNLNVSHSSDLKDGWYNYHIKVSLNPADPDYFPDRPAIGFTSDKIFISTPAWEDFVRVFNKADLLSGQVAQVTDTPTTSCGNPGTHWDISPSAYSDVHTTYLPGQEHSNWGWASPCANLSATSDGYLLRLLPGAAGPGGNDWRFQIAQLTGLPGNSPQLEIIATTPEFVYRNKVAAKERDDQAPGGWRYMAFDGQRENQQSNPFYRDGVITIATHQGSGSPPSVNELRVFQIATDGSLLTNETYSYLGADQSQKEVSYAYPAAVTGPDGTLYVGFDQTSKADYPSSYVTCKLPGESTLEYPPTQTHAGDGPFRWEDNNLGDFTGISLDECTSGNVTAYYAGQVGNLQYPTRLPSWVANFRFDDLGPQICAGVHPWRYIPTSSGTGPSARWDASVICDPLRNKLIMFGGFDGTESLRDLWTFDIATNSWTNICQSCGPSLGRRRHTAIYDPGRDRMVVFGGEYYHVTNPPSPTTRFNDVWALSLSSLTWTQLTTTGSPPTPRCSHAAIYDPDRDQMVIYGGVPWTPDKTWRLVFTQAGSEWVQIAQGNSPVAFEGCSAIFDPIGSRMLLFGGRTYVSAQCPQPWLVDSNEIYSLSLNAPSESWTQILAGGTTLPRAFASMVYDPHCQRAIIFGGVQDQVCDGSVGVELEHGVSDVSALNLTGTPAWSTLNVTCYGPTARGHHSTVFCSDEMYAFAGGERMPSETYHSDIWRMQVKDNIPPAAVTIAAAMASTSAIVSWNAPGDDGMLGIATEYDIRRSSAPITEANFFSATHYYGPQPLSAGTFQSSTVTGLTSCTWYYFAMKTKDDQGNWSSISNVLHKQTDCSGGGGCTKNCPEGSPLIDPREPLTTAIKILAPNPFAHSVVIHFSTDEPSQPEIRVFDVAGRLVRSEVLGDHPAGRWQWTWDGRSNDGSNTRSGIYFVHLRVGQKMAVNRVVKVSS